MGRDLGRQEEYRRALLQASDLEAHLVAGSNLPGPRANLELAQVAAGLFDAPTHLRLSRSEDEFCATCGAIGLGRLAAEGDHRLLDELRKLASDPRWRVREGVAMGLQRFGLRDMEALCDLMDVWAEGSELEQRAAIAAVCEPPLLKTPGAARRALAILDRVTLALTQTGDRRAEPFRVLRQALAYCWSVAAAADPAAARPILDRWLASPDPDVRWLLRQNLGKKRIAALGAAWVAAGLRRLE